MPDSGSHISVFISSPSEVVRCGLRATLEPELAIDVIGEAGDFSEETYSGIHRTTNIVVAHIDGPPMDGVSTVRSIKRLAPGVPLLVLSSTIDDAYVSLGCGATGFCLWPNTSKGELVLAIRSVACGAIWLHAEIAPGVLKKIAAQRRRAVATQERYTTSLSRREQEVLALLVEGLSNKEIAEHLALSEDTVKSHLRRVRAKLHVRGRTKMVVKVLQEQLLNSPDEDILGALRPQRH